MARYHNGMLIGKVGGLIFSSKNGVNYVKRAPKKNSKAPTAKQLVQREKFRIVMRFLSPLRGILNESYRKINPKTSGLHSSAKQILTESITGESPELKIDYSNVSLIRGNLQCPNVKMTYHSDLNELHLWWRVVPSCGAYLDDQLMALIYCPVAPQAWTEINTGAMRFEQGCVIQIPDQLKGRAAHIWLYYHSVSMESYSDSVYLGQILTKKQDQHENIQ